jgi:RNA polymerase sigma factor (sigma-70 family)
MTAAILDPELVERAKSGDLHAFEALANRHEQRVYSLAFRMLRQEQDAEDVTQQTFLSALENLNGFRGEASFSTWLLRITTHAALKVIRKRKGLETVSLELLAAGFNPVTAEGLRCRRSIGIGWMGEVFDCDFNQMLGMQVRNGKPLFLWDITPEYLEGWAIQTGDHCLACTAGCGSSCTGDRQSPAQELCLSIAGAVSINRVL